MLFLDHKPIGTPGRPLREALKVGLAAANVKHLRGLPENWPVAFQRE